MYFYIMKFFETIKKFFVVETQDLTVSDSIVTLPKKMTTEALDQFDSMIFDLQKQEDFVINTARTYKDVIDLQKKMVNSRIPSNSSIFLPAPEKVLQEEIHDREHQLMILLKQAEKLKVLKTSLLDQTNAYREWWRSQPENRGAALAQDLGVFPDQFE